MLIPANYTFAISKESLNISLVSEFDNPATILGWKVISFSD